MYIVLPLRFNLWRGPARSARCQGRRPRWRRRPSGTERVSNESQAAEKRENVEDSVRGGVRRPICQYHRREGVNR